MKWNKYIVCGMIISVLVIGGCSAEISEGGVNEAPSEGRELTAEAAADNGTTKSSDGSRPQTTAAAAPALDDQDLKDAQKSVILGKIVAIYGNYIQVNVADLPEKTTSRAGGIDPSRSEDAPENDQKNLTLAMGAGGTPQDGNRAPREGAKNGKSPVDMEFTGEIMDVMIPVGSRIYSPSAENLELTYDSLHKGMVVRIQVDLEMTAAFQDQSQAQTYYADNVTVVE